VVGSLKQTLDARLIGAGIVGNGLQTTTAITTVVGGILLIAGVEILQISAGAIQVYQLI